MPPVAWTHATRCCWMLQRFDEKTGQKLVATTFRFLHARLKPNKKRTMVGIPIWVVLPRHAACCGCWGPGTLRGRGRGGGIGHRCAVEHRGVHDDPSATACRFRLGVECPPLQVQARAVADELKQRFIEEGMSANVVSATTKDVLGIQTRESWDEVRCHCCHPSSVGREGRCSPMNGDGAAQSQCARE